MRARRSVWPSDEVRELAASFVTVADEVGRLQRGKDAECALFQDFCEHGHYAGRTVPTATRQGIYAVTPAGKLLASVNTTQSDAMVKMLRAALAKWRELPLAERTLDAAMRQRLEATPRFEDKFPADGLVLVEYLRDLGRPVDPADWRTGAWNTDQAWFTAAEAGAMVPADTAIGTEVAVPAVLVERLCCLHLVDTVRGQTPAFPREAVQHASLRSRLVRNEADRAHLELSGRTHVEQKGRWHTGGDVEEAAVRGVRTELTGRAVWDRRARRFVEFELIAKGERWGATQYNQRDHDRGPSAIGFAFVLAAADHPRVAPAFWWAYGWR